MTDPPPAHEDDLELVLQVDSKAEKRRSGEGKSIRVEPELIDDLADRLQTRMVSFEHSGPLPDPSTLARYEQVIPGLGRIIIDQMQDANKRASNEQDHRHNIDNRLMTVTENVTQAEITTTRIGQIAAIVLILLLFAVSVGLLVNGYNLGGFITLAIAIVGAVASQISPKNSKSPPKLSDKEDTSSEE